MLVVVYIVSDIMVGEPIRLKKLTYSKLLLVGIYYPRLVVWSCNRTSLRREVLEDDLQVAEMSQIDCLSFSL